MLEHGPSALPECVCGYTHQFHVCTLTHLLDSVTHELRTPLTSIKASVTAMLSQQGLDAASRTELLTVIDEENRPIGTVTVDDVVSRLVKK